MTRALIDCDMLVYQVGFGCQYKDEAGVPQVRPFDSAVDLLDQILTEIREESWCDDEPTMYLTGDRKLLAAINKIKAKKKEQPIEFKPNFREAIATTAPYKGNRNQPKPFHYDNIRTYILSQFDTKVAWGMEADDLLSIDHTLEPDTTILCSRDKDLRITPGTHYGWSCGKQDAFGPLKIDELGFLERDKAKIKGGGLKLFYAQMIMGDSVDNIPGLPGKGPAYAFKALAHRESEWELSDVVEELYYEHRPDDYKEYFLEQAQLLWMVRELDEQGNPVMFKPFWSR